MEKLFGGFPKFQTPKRRRGATPKHGRRKLLFPGISQNHNCGSFMVPSGFLYMRPARKNDLNFTKSQYFSMRLVLSINMHKLRLGSKDN